MRGLCLDILTQLSAEEVQDCAEAALDLLRALGFDMVTLLSYAFKKPRKGKRRLSKKLIYARTALLHSTEFSEILNRSAQLTKKATRSVDAWAIGHAKKIVVADIQRLALELRTQSGEFNKEELLSFSMKKLMKTMKERAPVLWETAHTVAVSPDQLKRNTYKKADPVSTVTRLRASCGAFERRGRPGFLEG